MCFQSVLLVSYRCAVPLSKVWFVVVDGVMFRTRSDGSGREAMYTRTGVSKRKDERQLQTGLQVRLVIARNRQPYRIKRSPWWFNQRWRPAWSLATGTSRTKHQESTTHASYGVLPMRWRSRPRRLPESQRRTQTGATRSRLIPTPRPQDRANCN